jgi:glycosyltransferase involved in cell wall biosynthesis
VTGRRVAIVSLGRDGANGEVRRVASWRALFESAGAEVRHLRLDAGLRPHVDGLLPLLQGNAAPERLAWSGRDLRAALDAFGPSLVIVVSDRAFDPSVTGGSWTVILDFVDRLSRSYRDRAELVSGGTRRLGYRALAAAHERLESRLSRSGAVHGVAAGWSDARRLGVEWVPIVVDPSLTPHTGVAPDRDVLFFGTLRYPPNVDALERLARIWPWVRRARPETTALIAGSAPVPRVTELCARNGWELVADFESLPAVAARARVAVAPLTRTAGIQIKVLDAAALGLPQVVTTAAMAGLDPDFPLTPFDDDAEFASEIVRVLDDPIWVPDEFQKTQQYVLDTYSVERWTEWARTA